MTALARVRCRFQSIPGLLRCARSHCPVKTAGDTSDERSNQAHQAHGGPARGRWSRPLLPGLRSARLRTSHPRVGTKVLRRPVPRQRPASPHDSSPDFPPIEHSSEVPGVNSVIHHSDGTKNFHPRHVLGIDAGVHHILRCQGDAHGVQGRHRLVLPDGSPYPHGIAHTIARIPGTLMSRGWPGSFEWR